MYRPVAWLAGGPKPAQVVDVMYALGEGNPFYTEQLIAAASAGPGDTLGLPAGLPTRLAELLTARGSISTMASWPVVPWESAERHCPYR